MQNWIYDVFQKLLLEPIYIIYIYFGNFIVLLFVKGLLSFRPIKDLLPGSVIRVLLVCLYHDVGFFATNCTFPKFISHLHTPPLHLFWHFAIKHLKKLFCRVSIVWFHTIHCSCLSLLKTINSIHNAVLFEVKIKNASKTSWI